MRALLLALLLTAVLLRPGPARADQVPLIPPASQVEIRTYGLGLLPLDGKFTRFHGLMRYDASNPTACQVILTIDTVSLAMDSDTIRQQIEGPEFMDATRFPELAFDGGCNGDTVVGNLTLHGQTHPFTLELKRSATRLIATGRLTRAAWGITARPLLGGSTIRIRVEIPNPLAPSHS